MEVNSDLSPDVLQLIQFIIGVFIPILTGIVTKAHASSGVKGVTNTLLSVIAGALTVVVDHGAHLDAHLGIAAFYVFVASTTSYKTLWKPTGVAAAVQNATGDVGIGKAAVSSPPVPPTPGHRAAGAS